MIGVERLLLDAAAFVGLAFVTGVVVLTVAATMVVRRVRRRWRALRERSLLRPHRPRPALLPSRADLLQPHWWSVQQSRRSMWRAVAAATNSVAVARRAGAPVGDLPTLVRQLEAAARSADALAAADARSPRGSRSSTAEVRRIEEAALQVHRAAVESLQSIAAADTDALLPAVRLEAAALAAGVRAAALARR